MKEFENYIVTEISCMNCWLPQRPIGSGTFTKTVSICLHCLVCQTCWLPVSLFHNLRLGTLIIFMFPPPPTQYLTHRWSIKVDGRKGGKEKKRAVGRRQVWQAPTSTSGLCLGETFYFPAKHPSSLALGKTIFFCDLLPSHAPFSPFPVFLAWALDPLLTLISPFFLQRQD